MIDKEQLIAHSQEAVTELGSPLELFVRAQFTQMLVSTARSISQDDLSLPQLAALHLVDHRKHMRIGELATELMLTLPSASRLTSELVDRGLMERREDEADRRAKSVTLTAAGCSMIEAISLRRLAESTAQVQHLEPSPVLDRFMAFYVEMAATGMIRKQQP
jgi:DNA-binding MarR family transcriptional regulator